MAGAPQEHIDKEKASAATTLIPWVGASGDFVKSITTIAAALLGVTVTFASQIIGKTDSLTYWILITAWGLSVLTITLGVVSLGLLVNFLKYSASQWGAALSANASFVSLVGAALAFT